MCPDRKTEWFDRNPDWHEDDRKEAKRIVRQRWTETYAVLASAVPTNGTEDPPSQAQTDTLSHQHIHWDHTGVNSGCVVAVIYRSVMA